MRANAPASHTMTNVGMWWGADGANLQLKLRDLNLKASEAPIKNLNSDTGTSNLNNEHDQPHPILPQAPSRKQPEVHPTPSTWRPAKCNVPHFSHESFLNFALRLIVSLSPLIYPLFNYLTINPPQRAPVGHLNAWPISGSSYLTWSHSFRIP